MHLLFLFLFPFAVVADTNLFYHYNVCNGLSNQLLHHTSSIAKAISLNQNVEIPDAFIVHGVQHTNDNVLPTEKNSIPLHMVFDVDYLTKKIEAEHGIQARIVPPDLTNSRQIPCADFNALQGSNPEVIVSLLQSFRPSGVIQNVVDHAMNVLKEKMDISEGVCLHHRDGKDWHDHCKRWENIPDGVWRKNCLNDKSMTFEKTLKIRAMDKKKRWLYYVGDHEIPQNLQKEFSVFSKDDLIDDAVRKQISASHNAEGERDIWAIIDYNLCTNLPYFVGNSVSTWSALQLAQRNGNNSYWYNAGSIPLSMFFNAYQIPIVYTYTELSPAMGKYMLKTSISSVRQHMPSVKIHLIYHGHEDKEFHQWLIDTDIIVHDHDPSWMDDIEEMRVNGNAATSHLFGDKGSYFGTWQRIDIPKFIHSEYCLFLDLDTVVAGPFTYADFGLELTSSIAFSSEHDSLSKDPWNAGVALMNVPKLRETYDDFLKFILEHKDGSDYNSGAPSDQGAYLEFYSDTIRFLPSLFNVKPYWNLLRERWKKTKVLHFHACKVHDYIGNLLGIHYNEVITQICNRGLKQRFLCPDLQLFARAAMRDDIDTLEGYCNSGFSDPYNAAVCTGMLKVLANREKCHSGDLVVVLNDVKALIGNEFDRLRPLLGAKVYNENTESTNKEVNTQLNEGAQKAKAKKTKADTNEIANENEVKVAESINDVKAEVIGTGMKKIDTEVKDGSINKAELAKTIDEIKAEVNKIANEIKAEVARVEEKESGKVGDEPTEIDNDSKAEMTGKKKKGRVEVIENETQNKAAKISKDLKAEAIDLSDQGEGLMNENSDEHFGETSNHMPLTGQVKSTAHEIYVQYQKDHDVKSYVFLESLGTAFVAGILFFRLRTRSRRKMHSK